MNKTSLLQWCILVPVLLFIALPLILVASCTNLRAPGNSEREKADVAAESGLSYIQYCITKYAGFTAGGIYDPMFDGFAIEQMSASQCIHGKHPGSGAEFYAAFCDGSGSIEKGKECSDAEGKNISYYSCNNLTGDSLTRKTLRCDGKNYGIFKEVPAGRAHIIVEGRCGKTRRYMEAFLQMRGEMGPESSIAAGDIEVRLSGERPVFVVKSVKGDAKIRSLGNIQVFTQEAKKTPNEEKRCFTIADRGISCTGNFTGGKATVVNGVTLSEDNAYRYGISVDRSDQSEFLKETSVTWENIAARYVKEGKFNPEAVKTTIASGTYVYRNSPEKINTYTLYYYPVAFSPTCEPDNASYIRDFVSRNKAAGEKAFDFGLISGERANLQIVTSITTQEFLTAGAHLFTIRNPVGISDENEGNLGFSVLIYDYDTKNKAYNPSRNYRTSVRLDASGGDTDPCIVTAGGCHIYIDGELSGRGKVLCGGDITFQGSRAIGKDSSLSAMDPGQSADRSIRKSLLIYTRGNAHINPARGSGGRNNVNDAIKTAWAAYTKTLGAPLKGYHGAPSGDFEKVLENLLSTKVAGTFTDSTGKSTTYSGARLSDILTDGKSFSYDRETAENLVSLVLSRNSYLSGDADSTEGIKTHEHNLFAFSSAPSVSTDSMSSAHSADPFVYWASEHRDLCEKVRLGRKEYYLAAGFESEEKETILALFDASNIEHYYMMESSPSSSTEKYEEVKVSTRISERVEWKFNLSLRGGGNTYDVKVYEGESGVKKWSLTYPWQNVPAIQLLSRGDSKFRDLTERDTIINGLIYSWKNIDASRVQGGSLMIRGALVAFGGDPSSFDPTSQRTEQGRILFKGGDPIILIFDSDAIAFLFDAARKFNTKRTSCATF